MLANDASFLKNLSKICDNEARKSFNKEIRDIFDEIRALNDEVKAKYQSHGLGSVNNSSDLLLYLQELNRDCLNKQGKSIILNKVNNTFFRKNTKSAKEDYSEF